MTPRSRRAARLKSPSVVVVLGTILLAVGLYAAGGVASEPSGSGAPTASGGAASDPSGGGVPRESGSPTVTPVASPVPTSPVSASPAPTPPASAVTPTAPPASADVTPAAGPITTAAALLETLPVKGRAPKTGYDRDEQFGTAWLDVDRNGCNTRDDILARDLVDVVRSGPCRVETGTLADPYTGTTIAFLRGQSTSSLVQIDHLVPLLDAWQTGAQQSTAEERVALANDPLNLEAADGSANSSKGAGDAATWLPPNTAFRCEYVARQVAVKSAYALWVTPAEHDAIARVLAGCPEQAVPTSG